MPPDGTAVPAQLAAFYAGADGLALPDGTTVYARDDLEERNATFETAEYCPGFLLIGDDSGGRGFLVSREDGDLRVYSSDLGDLGPEDFTVEAPSLAEWVAARTA